VNAINQNLAPAPAPAPVRQDAPQANAQSDSTKPGNSGSQQFSDVYNKAANGNGGGGQGKGQSGDGTSANTATDNPHVPAQTEATQASAATSGKVAGAMAKFAIESTRDTAGKAMTSKNADDAKGAADDAKAEADEKLALLTKAAKANAQTPAATAAASTTAEETDGVKAALKLLGAQVAKKTGAEANGPKDAIDGETKNDAKAKEDGADANGLQEALAGMAAQPTGKQQDESPGGEDNDIVYRFSKSDGSGPSMDMKVGKDQDALEAQGNSKPAKIETVSVLDARRYLDSEQSGLSSNAKSVLANVSGDKDWAAVMKAASAISGKDETVPSGPVNTLKIQMNPADLGVVTATLRLKGDELTVHLNVQSGEAFRQLSQDKDGLVQSLKSQGYSVDQVSIQLTAPPADKGVAQTATGQQSTGQQQMQDGSAGQFAQQGRGQDGNRSRQQDNGFDTWQNDEKIAGVEPSTAPPDSARAGRYL
jgi:chemotaxis protein MotD